MCALFYENRLGIKKNLISFFFTCFVREPYHSDQVIPHRGIVFWHFLSHKVAITVS